MLKSASARWSGNYLIKKTSEPSNPLNGVAYEDAAGLIKNYEELRAYALSPAKSPSRPLGLDLWIKHGFLIWIAAMLQKISVQKPAERVRVESESSAISDDLLIPITNILMKWNDGNG